MIKSAVKGLVILLSASLYAQDHVSYLPHFTQTAGKWNTVLNLTNPESTEASVVVQAWGVDGEDLGSTTINLGPTRGVSSSVADLFPEMEADKGWLSLNASSENVKGVMMFSDITTGGESGLPLIAKVGQNLTLPLLENEAQRQSGFVAVNLGEVQTTLTLTFTSLDASFKRSVTQTLEARSKLVAMLPALFGDDIPEKGRLNIDSATNIAGFALTFKNGTQQIVAVPGEIWDAGLLPEVQAEVDEFYPSHPNAGVSMGLKKGDDKAYVGAAGYANESAVAMAPDSIADIGSITKTFTAALILQLKEEGLLSLDDRLDQWITGVPNGSEITLRQMLNHTSGIYNYTNSNAFLTEWQGGISTGQLIVKTPQELVNFAIAEGPAFQPGSQWGYSNTNFILLGMIIEKATGQTYLHELRTRLLDPLGLKNTYLAGDEAVPNRARRYLYEDDSQSLLDVTDISHMSWAWAAGAMASTPEDLVKWGDALFGGAVLQEATLEEMKTPAMFAGPGANYGLGIALLTVGVNRGYGHDGATEGGVAFFSWFPNNKESLGLVVNQRKADLDFSPLILDGLRTLDLLRSKTSDRIIGLVEWKP